MLHTALELSTSQPELRAAPSRSLLAVAWETSQRLAHKDRVRMRRD